MTRPLVEDGLRFDVHRAVKAAPANGAWARWKWTRGGEPAGTIDYRVDRLEAIFGRLELSYRCDGRPFSQSFELEAAPCRFGGQRWFAICPRTRQRVAKLYSIGGAGFHARHAYGRLAYACQRDAHDRDRALRRRNRLLVQKLNGDDPLFVRKPKWMRRRTFDRLMAQLDAAEAECACHLRAALPYL